MPRSEHKQENNLSYSPRPLELGFQKHSELASLRSPEDSSKASLWEQSEVSAEGFWATLKPKWGTLELHNTVCSMRPSLQILASIFTHTGVEPTRPLHCVKICQSGCLWRPDLVSSEHLPRGAKCLQGPTPSTKGPPPYVPIAWEMLSSLQGHCKVLTHLLLVNKPNLCKCF